MSGRGMVAGRPVLAEAIDHSSDEPGQPENRRFSRNEGDDTRAHREPGGFSITCRIAGASFFGRGRAVANAVIGYIFGALPTP